MSELATAMELLAERNELEALRKQVRKDAQRIANLEARVEALSSAVEYERLRRLSYPALPESILGMRLP